MQVMQLCFFMPKLSFFHSDVCCILQVSKLSSEFYVFKLFLRYCWYSALATDTYAYVTSSDVRNICDFDQQTVVAIKAPSQTKLEISDPDEVKLIEWHCTLWGINNIKVFCHNFYYTWPILIEIDVQCLE